MKEEGEEDPELEEEEEEVEEEEEEEEAVENRLGPVATWSGMRGMRGTGSTDGTGGMGGMSSMSALAVGGMGGAMAMGGMGGKGGMAGKFSTPMEAMRFMVSQRAMDVLAGHREAEAAAAKGREHERHLIERVMNTWESAAAAEEGRRAAQELQRREHKRQKRAEKRRTSRAILRGESPASVVPEAVRGRSVPSSAAAEKAANGRVETTIEHTNACGWKGQYMRCESSAS